MHVVITGATGFVGRSLVRELLAAGHSVTALTREVERAARHLPARSRLFVWDAESAIDPHALRGAHWLVGRDLDAVFDFRRRRTQELMA
jgi:uncharacterized protein YbjT (DUF2867 family)